MKTKIPLKTALVSVFDKTGLEPLVKGLHQMGVQIYSTQGTANYLQSKLEITVETVESLTQFPELMEGRVKTLHPRIYGGILARREGSNDVAEAKNHGIPLFDIVVCNLYPFWEHLEDDDATQASFIDIGGPCMIRASAKNHDYVLPVSHPDDYQSVLYELETNEGASTLAFRKELAAKAFQRTSAYDQMIANSWTEGELPTSLSLNPQQVLRYGENPHQNAAWTGTASWVLLQGKELSYNNLLDTESAWKVSAEFTQPCITVVKHNNPCGVAAGKASQTELWERAFGADSKSAFGGIVAFNRPVDEATAKKMSEVFLEVIIAPEFSEGAKTVLRKKKNLRVIEWPKEQASNFEVRPSLGGWLVQNQDKAGIPKELKCVTKTKVPPEKMDEVKFAWLVTKHVRSNAIVLTKDLTTMGVGAGQMSRVDAVEFALNKAGAKGTQGAVLASDAFFPFRDNIDLLKDRGIVAVVQPGGSKRDDEVIAACDEIGIAMVFTGERHFRH